MNDSLLKQYIEELIKFHPQIESIWLIGSRANELPRDDSDWDILVFANREVLTKLRERPILKRKEFDLFIVYNDQDFQEAWPAGEPKSGNLKEWEWKEISSKDAVYKSVKSKGKDWFKEGMTEVKIVKAIKLWPV
jgi:predicted nucleotidyltransferase